MKATLTGLLVYAASILAGTWLALDAIGQAHYSQIALAILYMVVSILAPLAICWPKPGRDKPTLERGGPWTPQELQAMAEFKRKQSGA